MCDFTDTENSTVVLRPTPERIPELIDMVDGALHRNQLSSAEASRMRGKLGWVLSSSAEVAFRAAMFLVRRRQTDAAGAGSLTIELQGALHTLRHLLTLVRPRC